MRIRFNGEADLDLAGDSAPGPGDTVQLIIRGCVSQIETDIIDVSSWSSPHKDVLPGETIYTVTVIGAA